MIRLKSILIKGFKSPGIIKKLEFSNEPITVIYGENGSGKTTLLKILFAVFDKNETTLLEESVEEIELVYTCDSKEKKATIKLGKEGYKWDNSILLQNSSSILFGVHRGVIQAKNDHTSKKDLDALLIDLKEFINTRYIRNGTQLYALNDLIEIALKQEDIDSSILKAIESRIDTEITLGKIPSIIKTRKLEGFRSRLEFFIYSDTYQNEEQTFLRNIETQLHLSTDFVKIKDIQNSIVLQYNKGQRVVSEKIKNAFFETIEKAVEIDEKSNMYDLPSDFHERIEKNKDFILRAITNQDTALAKRIRDYVNSGNEALTQKSKIFRAMLLDIIESAEEPNPALESITKLIAIFNDRLYGDKKLVVDHEKAFIDLGEDKFHELKKLSSGERNLLSILTLFLIIGSKRSFLMIDEPEISLNIKWQREFLPLLNKLNSNAQIIVASHSPAIAHHNSNYLRELK